MNNLTTFTFKNNNLTNNNHGVMVSTAKAKNFSQGFEPLPSKSVQTYAYLSVGFLMSYFFDWAYRATSVGCLLFGSSSNFILPSRQIRALAFGFIFEQKGI